MVATIASFTNPDVTYDITFEHGIAVDCTCLSYINRRNRTCKHMLKINQQIVAEIDRAARFLAVKLQVQGMEETWKANRQIFYSEW